MVLLIVDDIAFKAQPSLGDKLTAERAEVITCCNAKGSCDDSGKERSFYAALSRSAV